MKKLTIFITLVCVVMISPTVLTQNWQPAGDNWIEKWWGLDLVTDTGGFNTSATLDYLSDGSGGVISNASVSTREGAGKTANVVVNLPDHGGALAWSIVTLNVEDQFNMSTSHGLPDGEISRGTVLSLSFRRMIGRRRCTPHTMITRRSGLTANKYMIILRGRAVLR